MTNLSLINLNSTHYQSIYIGWECVTVRKEKKRKGAESPLGLGGTQTNPPRSELWIDQMGPGLHDTFSYQKIINYYFIWRLHSLTLFTQSPLSKKKRITSDPNKTKSSVKWMIPEKILSFFFGKNVVVWLSSVFKRFYKYHAGKSEIT